MKKFSCYIENYGIKKFISLTENSGLKNFISDIGNSEILGKQTKPILRKSRWAAENKKQFLRPLRIAVKN